MNPGYIFGALALVLAAGIFVFDLGWKRGYKTGKQNAEDAFLKGARWYAESDDQVEAARKEIWRKEIGA